MIGIKATSKNAFCVTNNGSMKSENTPRNKFRTPFTDPRCLSEHVSYPICRPKMPLGTCSVPYLQTQDAHRNMFRTPFADPRCPSEHFPYPTCRVKIPIGTGHNQRKSSVYAAYNNHYNAHLKTKHAYGTVKPGAA